MKRFSKKFKYEDLNLFRDKLLKWSNKFTHSSFLNSNNYSSNIKQYECICAVELESEIPFTKNNSTQKLDNYLKKVDDWVFGYLNYDLKNEIEKYENQRSDLISKINSVNDVIGYLKAKDFKKMRSWVSNNIDTDTSGIFRSIYDSMTETMQPNSIPRAVLILADYQYKNAFVADHELNVVACLTELMAEVEWK